MPTVVNQEKRRSRKTRRCELCGGYIWAGSIYEHSFMVDGGDAWSFDTHLLCVEYFLQSGFWWDCDLGFGPEDWDQLCEEDPKARWINDRLRALPAVIE